VKAAFLPPALVLAATAGLWATQPLPAESLGKVPAFTLTDQHGRPFARAEQLDGRPWVADFVFTSCGGQCPVLTDDMKELDSRLKRSDARLVSISVDPEHDTPAVLAEYAKVKGASERWSFLTGSQAAISSLVFDGFHLPFQRNEGAPPGDLVTHTARLVLVDRKGEIRGYYEGVKLENPTTRDDAELDRLDHDLRAMGNGSRLPLLNATLNATSACFLLLGFFFIKLGWVRAHATSMISALLVSSVFLGFYLYYHLLYAAKPFAGEGFPKVAYLAVLISHVLLAVPTVVLAVGTATLGLRGKIDRHIPWARFTFPIWLYVSTSGVAVYALLYEVHGR
jgi:protein SCO1/2/putative membrane protein